MKFKTFLLLVLSLFVNQNLNAQMDLPPLNLSCGTPWVEAVQINWNRLINAEYYIIEGSANGNLLKKDTLTAFHSNYRFGGFDVGGPEEIKTKITAVGKPGFNNTSDSTICRRLACPKIELIVDFNFDKFCVGFDESILVQYIADFTDITVPDNWGIGRYNFTGAGISEFGLFNIEELPTGDHSFTISYSENDCIYSATKDFSVVVPGPVEIECRQDSFLNVLGIKWTDAPLAGGYQISINDSLITTQSHQSYLYTHQFPGEEININILPVGGNNCEYVSSDKICKTPNLYSISNLNKEEQLSIAPNPSNDIFEVFSKKEIEKIEAFDSSGRSRKEVFNTKIDLSNFNSGIYFLKIHTENNVFLKKVMKI